MRIKRASPDTNGVSIQLVRDHLKLIGSNPVDARTIDLGVYSNDGATLSQADAKRALSSLIGRVDGATCIAKTPRG